MLLAIRERVMGVLGWIILGLLFVAFAFFGLNSYLQSSAVNYAARVNDETILPARVQSAYELLVTRLQETLGKNYAATAPDEKILRKTALQKVINDVLVMQAADDLGFAASDRLVAAQINSIKEFRKDGAFSKDRYQQILRYQGMTPAEFEYRLKGDIMASHFKNGIRLTAAVTEQGLREAYALQGQLRRFSHVLIPAAHVDDQVKVTDADIEEYFSAHPEEFSTPERVRLQYLELDSASLPVTAAVDEDQLRALYNEQSARFVTPEQRHARHILISLQGDDDAALEASRSRAQDIEQRLDAGESFEKLAREFSDDPGSSEAGGDLGFFGRDVMTPEFEQAVFSMQPGERSQPVQTPFGLHIIELLEIKPETAIPLDEVRAELTGTLLQEERSEKFYDMYDKLANMAFEQPDTLQGAADELGLPLQETGWISRAGGEGLAADPDIVDVAFSDDVLISRNNSEVISTGEEHAVVIRVLEHQDAAIEELDKVRDKVRQAAHAAAVRELLEKQGSAMLDRLTGGATTLAKLAADESLKVEQSGMLQRNAETPSRELVSRVFAMPHPVDDKPVYAGMLTSDGSYAVIELQDVLEGNLDTLPESLRTQAWRNLNEIEGSNEIQMVVSELESKATIKIAGESPE